MEPPFFMFDIDLKNTEDKNLFCTWWNMLLSLNENLVKKLCYELTRSGGVHVYGKYSGVTQKTRLASNERGEEVISVYTGEVLSYCTPTPGYEMKHNYWDDIDDLTPDEFDLLVSCAAYFDKYIPDESSDEIMSGGIYPDEHKLLFEFFDRNCTDELFENLLNDIKLCSTGKTGTVRKYNATFHFFLRQGSTAKFSAKVFFTSKCAFIFSASYCNWPTFHTRHQYGFWRLTPTWLIYFSLGRDWNRTMEKINTYCDRLGIKLPESKKTVQYCSFWMNDFKVGSFYLNTGKLTDELSLKFGFCCFDKEYLQVIDGVIYKRDKNFLYNVAIELVSKNDISFKVKKNNEEIIFIVEKEQLKTKAQQTLHGYTGMLALPQFDKEMLHDNANEIYLHFQNKSLRISKNGISEYNRDNSRCME